jgi:hypothetical protein
MTMILDKQLGKKSCPSTRLATTNPTQAVLYMDPVLRSKKQVTNSLN